MLGPDSLDVFEKAGVTALALQADTTLIFDKDVFFKRADKLGMAIVAYGAEGPS